MIIKIKTFSGESLYIPEEDYLDEIMYSDLEEREFGKIMNPEAKKIAREFFKKAPRTPKEKLDIKKDKLGWLITDLRNNGGYVNPDTIFRLEGRRAPGEQLKSLERIGRSLKKGKKDEHSGGWFISQVRESARRLAEGNGKSSVKGTTHSGRKWDLQKRKEREIAKNDALGKFFLK